MKEKLNIKVINWILVLVFVIILFLFLQYTKILDALISAFFSLIPFFIGFFISWLLLPLSNILQKRFNLKEKTANSLSIIISIIILIGFFLIVIPQLIIQMYSFVEKFPAIWDSFVENVSIFFNYIDFSQIDLSQIEINRGQIIKYIGSSVSTITNFLGIILSGAYSVVVFILQIVFGYIIAFYFMGSIKQFVKSILSLIVRGDIEKKRKLLLDMSKTLFSYIRGVIIISCVVAFIMTIGVGIIGINEPLLFGMISGVTNVIPYLGPVIGGVPLFIVALAMGYKQALLVVGLIALVQFVESNFLQPKIMSKSTDLHPVTIMVGLLVFGSLFGIIGMVISTPVLAVLNVWLKQSKFKDKIRI